MSYQQSPVAPESSKSEAGQESSSKAEPDTDEGGTQLWKDMKAQTGFDSYLDYVAAYEEREHRYDLRLLWNWMIDAFHKDRYKDRYNNCCIVDVSAHEDRPPKLSTRCHSESGLELLAALRQPPKHVGVQIVVWYIGDQMSRKLLDKIGVRSPNRSSVLSCCYRNARRAATMGAFRQSGRHSPASFQPCRDPWCSRYRRASLSH